MIGVPAVIGDGWNTVVACSIVVMPTEGVAATSRGPSDTHTLTPLNNQWQHKHVLANILRSCYVARTPPLEARMFQLSSSTCLRTEPFEIRYTCC